MIVHQPQQRAKQFHSALLLTISLILCFSLSERCMAMDQVMFSDVTAQVGFPRTPANHYGGMSISDLDGDGYVDMIFGRHTLTSEIYMNNGDGTFKKLPGINLRIDAHGFNTFHLTSSSRTMNLFASRGGFRATIPNDPLYFSISSKRVLKELSPSNHDYNIYGRGRGRTVLAVNLRNNSKKKLDFLFLNAAFKNYTSFPQSCFTLNNRNQFQYIENFNNISTKLATMETGHFATVTDINNDMQMEVLAFHKLIVFQLDKSVDYKLDDITGSVLPRALEGLKGIRSIVELDYNNDGYMDLYISISTNNDLKWLRNVSLQNKYDLLLKNIKGKRYRVVNERVNLPTDIQTQGATVGDFNNDGLIDIYVTRHDKSDILFLNSINEKRRFKFIRAEYDFGYNRDLKLRGDQPMAVDYDRDGQMDLIVAEGDWYDEGNRGTYKVIKNVTPNSMGNSFLLVRVKSSPRKQASSLHALVTVCVQENAERCMYRRVGSPGVAVSSSYIEVVHFGLGANVSLIHKVSVKWVDRQEKVKLNVLPNRLIGFGS